MDQVAVRVLSSKKVQIDFGTSDAGVAGPEIRLGHLRKIGGYKEVAGARIHHRIFKIAPYLTVSVKRAGSAAACPAVTSVGFLFSALPRMSA